MKTFFEALIIPVTCLLLILFVGTCINCGEITGMTTIRIEAIRMGVARWEPDKNGNATFTWNATPTMTFKVEYIAPRVASEPTIAEVKPKIKMKMKKETVNGSNACNDSW